MWRRMMMMRIKLKTRKGYCKCINCVLVLYNLYGESKSTCAQFSKAKVKRAKIKKLKKIKKKDKKENTKLNVWRDLLTH